MRRLNCCLDLFFVFVLVVLIAGGEAIFGEGA